jgi:BirA family biotin operon repressor/biotin-[acetyl-CoA-carboxylase] ligase
MLSYTNFVENRTSRASRAPVLRVDRTTSTNDLAATLLRDPGVATPPFTTVIADAQVAGRGRLGRTWTALPGRSLTASTLVRLPGTPAMRGAMAWALLAAALSVREAVDTRLAGTGRSVGVKWPNDVVVDGSRKIAGLLGEAAGDVDGGGLWVVIGVGLNIAMEPAERPTSQATALSLEGDETAGPDPREAAQEILEAHLAGLERRVRALIACDGDARRAGVLDELRGHCVTLGRPVTVRAPDGRGGLPFDGAVARGILPDGSLAVGLPDGSTRTVTAGDVEMVSPP